MLYFVYFEGLGAVKSPAPALVKWPCALRHLSKCLKAWFSAPTHSCARSPRNYLSIFGRTTGKVMLKMILNHNESIEISWI